MEQALEVDVAAIYEVERAGLGRDLVEDPHVVHLAIGNANKREVLPCRSNNVGIFTAASCLRNLAQGNNDRHSSIVVES